MGADGAGFFFRGGGKPRIRDLEAAVDLSDPLAIARENYLRGAIDLVTFLQAVENIGNGIENSYGQALYDPPSDSV